MQVQTESRVSIRPVGWAVLGALAFAGAQVPLLVTAPAVAGVSSPGWFLNSGSNALVVGLVVALVAAAGAIQDLPFYGLGAFTAMVATLFAIGPGNIFPIVIVFGTCFLGVSIVVGGACGAGVRALRTLVRP